MDQKSPKNDRGHPVTRFCLAMEEHRRTPEGRVRSAKDLVVHFFPHGDDGPDDRLFRFMPNDVRGPVLSGWGIRGTKAALRDDDEKVRSVVFDALTAGDIDEAAFEEGITPQILIDWVSLSDWWTFWRKGKLTGVAIQNALATARALDLIDEEWFFENVEGRGGKLKGITVVCDTLSKDQVVAWLEKIHASGDGSPAGLAAAIGWETILQKTAEDALLFALDAFAKKAGLVAAPEAPIEQKALRQDEKSEAAPAIEESPKLAEARAQLMKMVSPPATDARKPIDVSEAPGRPSALEWPAGPSIGAAPAPPDAGSGIDIIDLEEDDEPVAEAPAPAAKAKPASPRGRGH